MYDTITEKFLESIETFQNQSSGWQFDEVEFFSINTDLYTPISGRSYIPLPKFLADKKAIINVINENDNECFKWAVTSVVYPQKDHPERLNNRMRENSEKFDWTGIEFPVDWKGIDKFEKQNPYKINVFEYEGKPNPVRIGGSHGSNVINLLLISNDETNHYCWIKNISRLISSEVYKNGHKRVYCLRCMNFFASLPTLKDHLEICSDHEAVRMETPVDKDGNPWKISFILFFKKMRVPFIVYADFECFTESISTCSPDDRRSYTEKYQSINHLASAISSNASIRIFSLPSW